MHPDDENHLVTFATGAVAGLKKFGSVDENRPIDLARDLNGIVRMKLLFQAIAGIQMGGSLGSFTRIIIGFEQRESAARRASSLPVLSHSKTIGLPLVQYRSSRTQLS